MKISLDSDIVTVPCIHDGQLRGLKLKKKLSASRNLRSWLCRAYESASIFRTI